MANSIKKCKHCGKDLFSHNKSAYCTKCQKLKLNKCINCGKNIGIRSKRCYSCTRKNHKYSYTCTCMLCKRKRGEYKGEKHPSYLNGTFSKAKEHKCELCGKKRLNSKYQYCHSCAAKMLWKKTDFRLKNRRDGENNSMYGKNHTEESKSKMSLSAGGNGTPYDYEDYFCFTENLKKKIRKRDSYTCQACGILEEEHLIINGLSLSIHHIDYDKKNNEEDNLISLCSQCHCRTNYNRAYWQNKLKNTMEEQNVV